MNKQLVAFLVMVMVVIGLYLVTLPDNTAQAVTLGNGHIRPVTVGHDYNGRAERVTGQFPVMCFDPLLTSTLILDPSLCKVNTQDTVITDDNTPENDTPVTPENPTIDNKPATPDKKHCNNGNGNGSEGCNASDKGNNDETPAKGDKAENHPVKEDKKDK